jgi:hypothetical protein
MRDKMNVRKPFRMTAFIRRRRSLSSHENRLWSGEKRFGRSQKWQDEFETHSYNVTAMEAQSSTGLPTVKAASLRGGILLSLVILILIFWVGFFGAIQLQDRKGSDFPDSLPGVRLLAVILPAA